MNTFLNITVTVLLLSCATQGTTSPESQGFYQKDLIISESNQVIKGLGVLPKRKVYRLSVESRVEPEIVRLSNCHRDIIIREPDDEILTYIYEPNPAIETGSCLLQISALDDKGLHQFGAISFQDDETLRANLNCNGQNLDSDGASACQAKAGTLQTIKFNEEVEVKAIQSCKLPTSEDGYTWEYSVKEGYCLFLFKTAGNEFHKLTTFGYDKIVKQ